MSELETSVCWWSVGDREETASNGTIAAYDSTRKNGGGM